MPQIRAALHALAYFEKKVRFHHMLLQIEMLQYLQNRFLVELNGILLKVQLSFISQPSKNFINQTRSHYRSKLMFFKKIREFP